MKILQVIPSVSLAHGGPSRAIRVIAQALTARGVEVEIATTDDDGPGRRFPPPCPPTLVGEGAFLDRFISSPTCGGGEGGRALVRFFPKRTEFYKISPAFARWVFQHVRDYDVVYIHALFSFTSVAAAWAARRAGVPYVVRPLGTLNQYGITQRRPWLKRLSLKFVEGSILRHAAAVHFTSMAEQCEAEALGFPMKSAVIPLGVAETQLPQNARAMLTNEYPLLAGQRTVLFLSRLDPKKNIESLLRAFALLVKTSGGEASPSPRPSLVKGEGGVRLLIAGSGKLDYVNSLKALADSLGLADSIVWAGNLDGNVKAAALAAADVFVLPSFSENFGIAAAEALEAGLPCVLGKGVAIAEEVQQAGAGLTVAPDAKSIAAALQTLLADEALRAAMAQKAAALAREKYSVDAMGAALMNLLYDRVLAHKVIEERL